MTITLDVTKRDDKTSVKSLRTNGGIPGVVYGAKEEAVSVSVEVKDFQKVLKEAGESTFVELKGLDKKTEVLIKAVEYSPVRQEIIHVDFLAIEAGKEMTATVPLTFTGEAPVEAGKLGVVNKVINEVEVSCKPADLPSHIDVSLEGLTTLEDKIQIKDINVPEGVKIKAEEDATVAVVNEMKEAEEDAPAEAVDMDAIEVQEKGKGEDVEGEAAAE